MASRATFTRGGQAERESGPKDCRKRPWGAGRLADAAVAGEDLVNEGAGDRRPGGVDAVRDGEHDAAQLRGCAGDARRDADRQPDLRVLRVGDSVAAWSLQQAGGGDMRQKPIPLNMR